MMAYGHADGTVTEVPLSDLKVGMVRAWNDGKASEITAIRKRTARSRGRLVSYRAIEARQDGHHNTITLEVSAGSFLPIITVNPPSAGQCPDGCTACQAVAKLPVYGLPV